MPCFAELRRVPAASIVEQGLTAITVDAEGAEDFRYAGLKDKRHTYVGKIKPESKIKFVIGGSLKNAKELPITGRTNLIRLQVTVKKGDTVIKTENFRKENMSNVFLNYTVPKDADTLEVIEVFTLTNKSKDSKFNQKVTTVNKLILSSREEVLAAALGQPVTTNSPDKKQPLTLTARKQRLTQMTKKQRLTQTIRKTAAAKTPKRLTEKRARAPKKARRLKQPSVLHVSFPARRFWYFLPASVSISS